MAPPTRYRYRSPVLHGPWRNSQNEAVEDAITAGQAVREGEDEARIHWRDSAGVEEENEEGRLKFRPQLSSPPA